MIAEGSFPELRRIEISSNLCSGSNCDITNTCNLRTFLPQLLINKGNQLAFIDVLYVCHKSMEVVWKALKYCKAAKSVRFGYLEVASRLTVTFEDVNAICSLRSLQFFKFSISQREGEDENDADDLLPELIKTVVKEHADFQFEDNYINCLLYRVHF